MKRKVTIWLCILTLLVTLTGCSSSKKNEDSPVSVTDSVKQEDIVETDTDDKGTEQVPITAEGNYIENVIKELEMEPDEYQLSSKISGNHQYELYTVQNLQDGSIKVYCYTLVGDTLQKTSVDWADSAIKDLNVKPNEICQSEDGNTYMLGEASVELNGNRRSTYKLLKKTEDEKGYLDITPSYWYDENSVSPYAYGPVITNCKVLKNQMICYSENFDFMIHVYDLNKDKVLDFGSYTYVNDYAIKDNTVYYLDYDNKQIQVLHVDEDKSETIALDPSIETNDAELLLQIGLEKEIIILNNEGLHILKNGGSLWEVIVDGSQYSMSVPSYNAQSLLTIQDTSTVYYVLYKSMINGKKDILTKYIPSADSVATFDKELTICSLYDNVTVREAISQYRRLHPNIKISYEVMMTEGSAITQADIVNSLNTEILAGKGPDILLMDDLPLSSYMEKGVLMDISDIFNNSGENTLIKNISDCYTSDQKIYCMPMRVYMPIYAMSEDISSHTSTVEELAAYCENRDKNLIEPRNYDQLAKMFVSAYSDGIFTEDGLIDKDGLTSFLKSLDTIAKQTEASIEGNYGDGYSSSGIQGANLRMSKIFYGIAPNLMMYDIDSTMSVIGDEVDLSNVVALLQGYNGLYTPINNSFIPNGIIGINQKANEPELAKEFISLIFSESVQSLHLSDGFPVNEKALNSWVKIGEPFGGTGFIDNNGQFQYIPFDRLSLEDTQNLVDKIKALTNPVYSDANGKEIIIEGAVEYLSGSKTLEQAVSDIMQKANLYFSE